MFFTELCIKNKQFDTNLALQTLLKITKIIFFIKKPQKKLKK